MIGRNWGGTIRLNLFLRHLDVFEWRSPLKHIGIHTAANAEKLGLVEVSRDLPVLLYRLTTAGAYRRDEF